MSLICPEITLYNLVVQLLEFVRADYAQVSDKNKSYLAKLLKGLKLGEYDYYEQAIAIFMRGKADPRFLDVHLFFNQQRSTIPTIHINLPGEQPNGNGLGLDQGYQEEAGFGNEDTYHDTYTRRYETQYQLIVTSNNPVEVAIIYRVLKALITSAFDDVIFAGLEDPKLSGYDLQMQDGNMPMFFSRALRISTAYEDVVPDVKSKSFIKTLSSLGTPK